MVFISCWSWLLEIMLWGLFFGVIGRVVVCLMLDIEGVGGLGWCFINEWWGLWFLDLVRFVWFWEILYGCGELNCGWLVICGGKIDDFEFFFELVDIYVELWRLFWLIFIWFMGWFLIDNEDLVLLVWVCFLGGLGCIGVGFNEGWM